MKKFFKWFAIIVVGLFVIGLLLPEDESTSTSTSSGAKVDEVAADEEGAEEALPTDEVFKVGDVVDLNGRVVTIKSAKFVPAAEYSPSENGKILELEVNVVNNTDEQVFVSSGEFNLYNAEGLDQTTYFGSDSPMLDATLNKGKQANGFLVFDVTEGTNYELIYTPSFSWTDEKITWDIQAQ